MVWTTPAIDPKLGLMIFSTGNPNPDLYGASRMGDNLYTDSIVALDIATGKLMCQQSPERCKVSEEPLATVRWSRSAPLRQVFRDGNRIGRVVDFDSCIIE